MTKSLPGGVSTGAGVSSQLPLHGPHAGGFDVEPAAITDFKGASALAFHVGSAPASDGRTYNLETDIRAFEGEYVVDGEVHRGAFALI